MSLEKTQSFIKRFFFSVFFPLVVISFLWILQAKKIGTSLIVPFPSEVFERFLILIKMDSFKIYVVKTLFRVLQSFFISLFISICIGIAAGICKPFRLFIQFPMGVIKATPVVSFILLAIFWFTTDSVPVFIGVLMTVPVMSAGIVAGIQSIDKKIQGMLYVYKVSFFRKLSAFYIPSVSSYAIPGALTSFSLTWKVVVASEVIALPQKSIGFALQTAKIHLETADVFALTILIVCVSFFLENILSIVLNFLLENKFRLHTLSSARQSEEMVKKNIQHHNLSLKNFSITRGNKNLYENFSITFDKDSVTAIIAPSGAGKTTLFDYIAGLLSNGSGEYSFGSSSNVEISYLFQEPRLLPSLTILENTALVLYRFYEHSRAITIAREYLEKVGLSKKINAFPKELSGGEKQRVALARGFAYPGSLFFMDEAFQSQDIHQKLTLMTLFKKLIKEEPRTVLLVTHTMREALLLSDRIVVLEGEPLSVILDTCIKKEDFDLRNNYVELPKDLMHLESLILDALL